MARPVAVLVLLAASSLTRIASSAPPVGGTVQGVVVLPSQIEAPPAEHLGYLTPIENRVAPLRQIDPFPEMFVFLEPSDPALVPAELRKPTTAPVIWNLASSFAVPVLPVVTGSTVKVVNNGRESHLLYSTDAPELLPKDPLGKATSRDIVLGDRKNPLTVRSRSVPHVVGTVVPLPSRLFARVDRSGKFRFEGIPAGRWTVNVWYRGGWLSLPKSFPFDVATKPVDVKVELPDPLKPGGK